MIYITLFPNRYIQGPNSIQRLGIELSKFGPNSFAICTPFVFEKRLLYFQKNVNNLIQFTVEKFGGECSDEEIDRLSSLANTHKPDIIVGIGGGKTLDTAKAVAYELKRPVAIVPTIASTDAPCSALSVLYTQTGELKRYLKLSKNPAFRLKLSQTLFSQLQRDSTYLSGPTRRTMSSRWSVDNSVDGYLRFWTLGLFR